MIDQKQSVLGEIFSTKTEYAIWMSKKRWWTYYVLIL